MVVLDTDFVVAVLRKDPDALRKLAMYVAQQRPMCITAITMFELFRGVQRSDKPELRHAQMQELIHSMFCLDFSSLEASEAARIEYVLAKNGTLIGELDTLIAGSCIAGRETLITRNTKHFEKIPELKVEKW